MATERDGFATDISCPHCGCKTVQAIRWIEKHDELKCADCGSVIFLDHVRLGAAVERVERDLRARDIIIIRR